MNLSLYKHWPQPLLFLLWPLTELTSQHKANWPSPQASYINKILLVYIGNHSNLSPLRLELRCLKASSGTVAIGLPSRANRVNSLIPTKACSGKVRIRLKPRSRTWKVKCSRVKLSLVLR
jgi:hypothetical protein